MLYTPIYLAMTIVTQIGVCKRSFRPRTHGNVFLRFCIVYCSQGNREQPTHYLCEDVRCKTLGNWVRVSEHMLVNMAACDMRYCNELGI